MVSFTSETLTFAAAATEQTGLPVAIHRTSTDWGAAVEGTASCCAMPPGGELATAATADAKTEGMSAALAKGAEDAEDCPLDRRPQSRSA
mmetsp:Transcript_3932/g.8894  ORF Transcript_3932/g.8894 Transcript_3932/m.8894 type:complete len:90 (+) Transcript_3932:839-1108(+)